MENQKYNYIITYNVKDDNVDYEWQSLLRQVYESARYSTVVGQLERGSKKGRIHVQAFVHCTKKLRGTQVLKDWPEGTWFKKEDKFQAHGRVNAGFRMQEYCKKEDTRISSGYLQLGEPLREQDNAANGKRGREVQIAAAADTIAKAERGQFKEIAADHMLKYYSTIKRIHVEHKSDHLVRGEFQHPFREWQRRVMEYIAAPNGRLICWVYDSYGAAGKSTFGAWLALDRSYFYMQGGDKKQDVLFQLKEHHTTLHIDIPCDSSYRPYQLLEVFLTGHWRASKYEGDYINRRSPGAALVTSNLLPNFRAFKRDRLLVLSIKENGDDFEIIPQDDLKNYEREILL